MVLKHRGSAMCEQPGAYIALKVEFKEQRKDAAVVPSPTTMETIMKLTTIALAIAFALPSTFALARGGMSVGSHVGSHVTRPFSTGGAAGRIANRPRNVTGNTLAPIAHDPSGSTVTGSATNRTGG
jgi:hypothetical protein